MLVKTIAEAEASDLTPFAKIVNYFGDATIGTAVMLLAWLFTPFVTAVIVAHSLQKVSTLVLYLVGASFWIVLTGVITSV